SCSSARIGPGVGKRTEVRGSASGGAHASRVLAKASGVRELVFCVSFCASNELQEEVRFGAMPKPDTRDAYAPQNCFAPGACVKFEPFPIKFPLRYRLFPITSWCA